MHPFLLYRKSKLLRDSYSEPVIRLEFRFEDKFLKIAAEHAPDRRIPHEIRPDTVLNFKYALQRVTIVLRVVAPRDAIGRCRLI